MTRHCRSSTLQITVCVLFMAVIVAAAHASLRPIAGKVLPSEGKATFVYKITPEGELKINLYFPKGWKASDRRPAIVFFFGGGFKTGTTGQLEPDAEYLASRGMVAACADYRVSTRQKTGADKSIEDAKSAVRWMRANARALGVDQDRVVAGGASAGATSAAFTAYNTTYEPTDEDTAISERPNALVLFNPALGFVKDQPIVLQYPEWAKAVGPIIINWKVTKGGPPAILFFGTKDEFGIIGRNFVEQMLAAGNRAELYTAAGVGHGFFNPVQPGKTAGVAGWYEATVYQTDLFLASLGYLKGRPTIALKPGIMLKKALP